MGLWCDCSTHYALSLLYDHYTCFCYCLKLSCDSSECYQKKRNPHRVYNRKFSFESRFGRVDRTYTYVVRSLSLDKNRGSVRLARVKSVETFSRLCSDPKTIFIIVLDMRLCNQEIITAHVYKTEPITMPLEFYEASARILMQPMNDTLVGDINSGNPEWQLAQAVEDKGYLMRHLF
ncbi:hypothetical protein VNO77_14552 [Canavalia gladiata]|uniref:Uncharacterized protein n=1 Tax=Canavalia gladiata TaxID=3824 RepID=A0AAN9M1Y6_CANGL